MQKVVIVGDPESVKSRSSLLDVRAECDTFNLGWNLCSGDAVVRQELNEIEEYRLINRMDGGSASVHLADVGSPVQIDLEELLDLDIVSTRDEAE